MFDGVWDNPSMVADPRSMVRSHDVVLDDEYADWIRDVKRRYRGAQVKAAVFTPTNCRKTQNYVLINAVSD